MRCCHYDHRCPVCLGDYQAEDRLQQIPLCGHTFHMDCIDLWLSNHTTCPLCRLSLLASSKIPIESLTNQVVTVQESSAAGNAGDIPIQPRPEACEELQATQLPQPMNEDSRTLENNEEEARRSECAGEGRELSNARNETEEQEHNREFSGNFAILYAATKHTFLPQTFYLQGLIFLTRMLCSIQFLHATDHYHLTNSQFNCAHHYGSGN